MADIGASLRWAKKNNEEGKCRTWQISGTWGNLLIVELFIAGHGTAAIQTNDSMDDSWDYHPTPWK